MYNVGYPLLGAHLLPVDNVRKGLRRRKVSVEETKHLCTENR